MSYAYGYCGMPCALCSRYRTRGESRCPGCSNDGYYSYMCKAHHCCKEKQLHHCGECEEYPCKRLGNMADFRDLNTGSVKKLTCAYIKERGFDEWYKEFDAKAALLDKALEMYDNGRMKRYLCELFIQNGLETLKEIMHRSQALTGDAKQKAPEFKKIAEELRK